MSIKKLKISIIVPVYNVEKYLNKCIQSLVNQTYKNIEILLIDDGSTDLSGSMCDNYAQQYANVMTFHKENGGLSSARNFGLEHASGEYVSFVDSDDYVDPLYIEYMIKPITNAIYDNIDIVISSIINDNSNNTNLSSASVIINNRSAVYVHMTAQDALEAMCFERQFGVSACAKIIRTTIAKQNLFPVGKIYEDLATTYKMLGAAQNIIFINVPMYYYVNRDYSIRHSEWAPSAYDVMNAAHELLDYIDHNYPFIHDAAVYRYFMSANELYIRAFQEDTYKEIIAPVREKLIKLLPNITNNRTVPIMRKLQCVMMAYVPCLYRICRQVYKMRRGL